MSSGGAAVSGEETADLDDESSSGVEAPEVPTITPPAPTPPQEPERPKAIFVGHGKDKGPLAQLEKILGEYKLPHTVAQYEANTGRPIPPKVADTMRECGAAILIFTPDEELFDLEGNPVWRPRECRDELGAASVLYDNRIIIFKERSVTLPTNYNSIGYIEFDKHDLSAKAIELFRELIAVGLVKISVG